MYLHFMARVTFMIKILFVFNVVIIYFNFFKRENKIRNKTLYNSLFGKNDTFAKKNRIQEESCYLLERYLSSFTYYIY